MVKRFGLESCANTIVGSTFNKGVSGGEKRRLSIACEVVTEPRVLVLDEPTSGLDPRTALSVLELLHQLSSDGCTVILSIHQPSSAMSALISTCLLLSPDGRPVYAADANQMASYFDRLGYTCPHTASLDDFVIDITAASSSRELESLIDKWTHWQSSEMSTASESPTLWHLDPSGPKPNAAASFLLPASSCTAPTSTCSATLSLCSCGLANAQVWALSGPYSWRPCTKTTIRSRHVWAS